MNQYENLSREELLQEREKVEYQKKDALKRHGESNFVGYAVMFGIGAFLLLMGLIFLFYTLILQIAGTTASIAASQGESGVDEAQAALNIISLVFGILGGSFSVVGLPLLIVGVVNFPKKLRARKASNRDYRDAENALQEIHRALGNK